MLFYARSQQRKSIGRRYGGICGRIDERVISTDKYLCFFLHGAFVKRIYLIGNSQHCSSRVPNRVAAYSFGTVIFFDPVDYQNFNMNVHFRYPVVCKG